MTTRPQKITFDEMREMGICELIYCADSKCSPSISISADRWPDHVRLSCIEPGFVCTACGKRGANVRPNFFPPKWGPNMKDALGLLCTGLGVGTILFTAPAQAQTYDPNYPICLQVYDDMVHYYFECTSTSMAQCAASASGRSAQCVVNSYYAKPGPRKKRFHR